MTNYPCPIGRSEAAALAVISIRTVLTGRGVQLVLRPGEAPAPAPLSVGPRFQPRDRRGRFVPYARLRDGLLYATVTVRRW